MRRANLRGPLLTGKARSPPFKDHDDAWLVKHWPDLLDCHFMSPRPGEAACMTDVAKMLDTGHVCVTAHPASEKAAAPRKLSDAELEAIKAWHEEKTAQLLEQRGDIYVAERNLASLANSHHDQAMEAHASTQQATKDAAEALKVHISDELATLRRPKTQRKEKIVGLQVKASRDDDAEMGAGVVWDVVHVEQQTWTDGQMHKVVLLKAEGQPNLLRDWSTVSLYDPFQARGPDPVRVTVISRPDQHAQYHIGWRGIVHLAKASAPNVKVNFPFLKMGKIAQMPMLVPRTALRILGDDDISMMPNRHPWLGRRVTVLETNQEGQVVDVDNKGRVRFRVDGRKGVLLIETKSSSFDALFSELPGAADQVSPDPTPIAEVEAPQQPQAAAQSIADSDAESEGEALTPGKPVESRSEPIAPAAKRGKGQKQPAKATAVKRRPASNVSAPASKRRRNTFSLGNVD